MNKMADQDEKYGKSWILYHVLDRCIGSREMVAVRRKLTVVTEQIENGCKSHLKWFYAGSSAEGIRMAGSDRDFMIIDNNVMVTCPDQSSSNPTDSTTTVFMMRESDGRAGFVKLELVNQGQIFNIGLAQCLVPVGDVLFISSEIYSRGFADAISTEFNAAFEQHGPASTFKSNQSYCGADNDIVISFPCTNWPREVNEWISRTRLNEWPGLDLRNQIVKGGCHLVPVGDKTSPDTFLQWRISFVCAERKLMYSLSHVQFLVYGLLKYFLKQISHRFEQMVGDKDIISSYIMKTIIFHAVENTPSSLWQERYTFHCFMLCFNILIVWVNAGHCPNYFIQSNNMFLGKVHGENQQKLLRILTELRDMQWKCLSVGTVIQPSIGARINNVQNGEWKYVLPSPAESERKCDWEIFTSSFLVDDHLRPSRLKLLLKSESDIDEFIAYIATVQALSRIGIDTFESHVAARGNKEKYKHLRKCKELLGPLSSVCTSPGLLKLATYHYQTGNYIKTLEMCRQVISSFKVYFGDGATFKDKDRYEHRYCGRGYTLLHKCREVCAWELELKQSTLTFCPPQLHKEMTKLMDDDPLLIPPLPYAVFLSILCFHDLGDTKRRDTALTHLRALKYDEEQGVCVHWIVHNLLGTCYEMVGDTRRALREYRESLGVQGPAQFDNTARDSIERLRHLQEEQVLEHK